MLLLQLVLLFLRRCTLLSGIGASLGVGASFWRFAAIFFEQLLRGVVLGRDFELLDGLAALLVQLIEMALASGDAVFKETSTSCAHSVYTSEKDESLAAISEQGESQDSQRVRERTAQGHPQWRRTP